jgi:hypothetical protein
VDPVGLSDLPDLGDPGYRLLPLGPVAPERRPLPLGPAAPERRPLPLGPAAPEGHLTPVDPERRRFQRGPVVRPVLLRPAALPVLAAP